MIDTTKLKIDALTARLDDAYRRMWGSAESDVPEIVKWAVQLALENIARSDALYHDVDHTMLVTHCGAEIMRCRHLIEGGVTPDDWLHTVLSLLFHDIGYVRGVCRGDRPGGWITGTDEEPIRLPAGTTDAALRPWHVDRGIRFVRERFTGHPRIDPDVIARNIDYTRFPIPDLAEYAETNSYRGLVRAADLIGQLADPYYLRKLPALFHEFEETGLHTALGFRTPSDMRSGVPDFYANQAQRWVTDGLAYLAVTAEGRRWIATLHDHLHSAATLAPDAPA
ncbi:MAG: metal-dependent phosphohydrolase [Alphaproteobacteria bacterium]|nr:metal-dependent phosphohydrolase [Alphaproteobacteria bacterium]